MARPLRVEFPGGLYHIISRGNGRQRIVRDDADRKKRVDWLRRTVETYGWELFAFVLLSNHEHVFLETPQRNLSAGMQYLNGSYTGYFNRRHRRPGHLFQGRFKAHLIEEEGYFLEVSRYIHLNPVRAKIVAWPQEYGWSSYAGYQRASGALEWVSYDRVLGEFGRDAGAARRGYCRFVRAGIEEPPRSPFADPLEGLLVGSSEFVDRIRGWLKERTEDRAVPQLAALRSRPSLEEILEAVLGRFGQDGSKWCTGRRSEDASRAVAAYLARRDFGYSAKEVAEALGYRSHGGVRNAIARVEGAGESLKTTVSKLLRKLR